MFLKPDYNLKSIYDIDFMKLKASGVKALLFDLDSTIMASKSGYYSEKTSQWLQASGEEFFIAVISNNKNLDYINKVKKISHFPILFDAGKPRVSKTKKFLKEHNININECILIGDRPLTDVLCGKFLGCKTVLVDSITADTESKLVRFVRKLERLVIRS